jgi:ATP-dependent RNA helicase HelY
MLPVFKEVVEELFTAGLVKAVFATETLALGINMPARTVVLEKLDKWNGEAHVALTPGEYTQLTGRAGRRGIDVEGHAVVLWQPGMDPGSVAGLAGTRTYPLNSSFRPSYNMAVNLTARVGRKRASALLESSFAQFQADRGVVGLARRLRRLKEATDDLARKVTCDRGDFMEYAEMRRKLSETERGQSRSRASAQRAEARRTLGTLRRGDIIRVPSGRRVGLAVVLNPPPAGDEFSPNRADGPLVLTVGGQLKQLSATDFPVPAEPVGRLRIPNSFSERSPKHRRDLVSAMRSKVAGRDLDPSPRHRRAGQLTQGGGAGDEYPERGRGSSYDDDDFPESDSRTRHDADDERDTETGDIAALRRRLRRHPCHACPDREQHARYAERYFRQKKEADELERQVGGRRHVIARTFDRVCGVLDELGYLDGDAVTPAGQRLTRLYSELDLLAAECLRRGVWEGLNPAELAACVSVLSFESRKQTEEAGPARLPKGPVRDVLTTMARTWGELDHLEQRHGLSFLREPDPGFVWAAYRWVRGAKLEDVLDSVPGLTPGDFVRSMKQLIDLLDQIAVAARSQAAGTTEAGPSERPPSDRQVGDRQAGDTHSGDTHAGDTHSGDTEPAEERPSREPPPKSRDVASTARAAIDAMRRGVVAYTTLTD